MLNKLALFLLLMALALPAKAQSPEVAPPPALDLGYSLYAGGLRVVEVSLAYNVQPNSYDLYAVAKTRGIWASLVPWRNMIKVFGAVENQSLSPKGARYDDVWKEKARTTEFTFREDGVVTAAATPPFKKDGRVEATEDQRKGALDPLSAVVLVMSRGPLHGCTGKIPAFDGRRLFNLVLNNKGEETLPRSRYNLYSGPATRCEVTFEPVAGFPPKGKKAAGFWSAQNNTDKANPLIIWMASPRKDYPLLPIRVQSATEYGTIVAHLRTAAPQPATLAAAQ